MQDYSPQNFFHLSLSGIVVDVKLKASWSTVFGTLYIYCCILHVLCIYPNWFNHVSSTR